MAHGVALLAIVGLVSWYLAFRQTPDLDGVGARTMYRTALMLLYMRALEWLLRGFGWL